MTTEKPRLSENESLYALLFENSMDGLMLTAPDGRILDANPAACLIFGRSREEILQAGREGLIDSRDPRLPDLIAERQKTGKVHAELNARRKDGTLFLLEFSSMLFTTPQGEQRTCLILRDISSRKTVDEVRENLIQELQQTLARVKTLSGLLPMCAACRKIRDKQDVWHNLESYIRTHTEADFSHGICPDCRRQLYPETIRP